MKKDHQNIVSQEIDKLREVISEMEKKFNDWMTKMEHQITSYISEHIEKFKSNVSLIKAGADKILSSLSQHANSSHIINALSAFNDHDKKDK